jgi:biotin carboxyl carrier protein
LDLTNEDVADILALLDSLPYDSLDVETPRFRLTLRRAPDGGWTEESQVLAEPSVVPPPYGAAGPGEAAAPPGAPGAKETAGAAGTAPVEEARGTTGLPGAEMATGVAGTPRAQEADVADGMAGPGEADGASADPAGAQSTARVAGGADGLAVVAAALPGTFYRAPRPGAEPFVQAGDEVTEDTVVAIIETMKLMNSVHAGTAGRVARICVGNGEFAALGTTLMLIEPAP